MNGGDGSRSDRGDDAVDAIAGEPASRPPRTAKELQADIARGRDVVARGVQSFLDLRPTDAEIASLAKEGAPDLLPKLRFVHWFDARALCHVTTLIRSPWSLPRQAPRRVRKLAYLAYVRAKVRAGIDAQIARIRRAVDAPREIPREMPHMPFGAPRAPFIPATADVDALAEKFVGGFEIMLTSKCPECAGTIEMPAIGRGSSVRMACPICHCWMTVTLGVTKHYDASQFALDVNGVPVRPLEKP